MLVPETTAQSSAPRSPHAPAGWTSAAGVLALVVVVLLAYAATFHAGFVWDDDGHVTAPGLRTLHGLWRIWFDLGATQQYYPLLHSAFWVEHRLWGDAPIGYHVANLLFHSAAASLAFILLRRLAMPGAFLAALIFALHPVHVESVAWISEQKNTLSAVFYLGAALAYLRFERERRRASYALATLLFVAALLTKSVTATLPAALAVVIWWRNGRLTWRRDVLPLVPWLVIGAAAGLLTAWVERRLIGAEGAAFDLSALQRLLLAGRVFWFYLGKLFWPANLTFIYPRWTIAPAEFVTWLPLLATAALLGLLWLYRSRQRAPFATVLLFGGTLFPALGFFNVYPFRYSFVADHFQYLASLPVIAAVASLIARGFDSPTPLIRRAAPVAAGALVVGLATLTWPQTQLYRTNETLLRATLERNPSCWMAANNIGKDLMNDRARLPEAIALFERALALFPDYFEARNNLGLALTQVGRPADAIPHLEAALRLKPGAYRAHNNLGIALASSGRAEAALASFAEAARLNPTMPNIEENWAKALLLLGRKTEASQHFARAAQLRAPNASSTAP